MPTLQERQDMLEDLLIDIEVKEEQMQEQQII